MWAFPNTQQLLLKFKPALDVTKADYGNQVSPYVLEAVSSVGGGTWEGIFHDLDPASGSQHIFVLSVLNGIATEK